MNILNSFPEYLTTAIVAAIFATLGFFARKVYDRFEELRAKKNNTFKKLEKLRELLEESKSIFDNQDYLVRRLSSLLKTEFGNEYVGGNGYDETFFRMYPMMTDEQLELFALIRGCTMNSMRRINEELLHWVRENSKIELGKRKSSEINNLNAQLIQLKKHLNLWFDKYEAILKVNHKRSLIYLADEKGHGESFPLELQNSLNSIFAELNQFSKVNSIKINRQQQFSLDNFKKELAATLSQINVSPKSAKSEFDIALDIAIEQIAKSVDMKTKEFEGHTQRVTEITLRIATAMGISGDELTKIRHGALLHDIGKIGVPEEILHKKGPLTKEEIKILRQHPVYSKEILQSSSYLHLLSDIPYCHHENWDGTGYPRKIRGLEIPLAARIFVVADVWEALCTDRPYRQAWSQQKASEYIRELSGKDFDPEIVEVFLGTKV